MSLAQESTNDNDTQLHDAPDLMFGAFFLFPDSIPGVFVPMETNGV